MQLGNHLFYTCLKQFHCEEMSHEFLNKYSHRSLKQERCSCCLNLFNSGYHYNSRRPDLPQFIMKVYKEHTRGNCRGANAEYVTCNTQVSLLFFIFFIFYFFYGTTEEPSGSFNLNLVCHIDQNLKGLSHPLPCFCLHPGTIN